MRISRSGLHYIGVLSLFSLLAGGVGAQELYNFTFSALGSMGGTTDANPDPGFSNNGFQLGASIVTESRVHAALRLGVLDFGDEFVNHLTDAELSYATIAGEYYYHEGWYESGLIFGLGAYQLDGTNLLGESEDETAFGITAGVNGLFELTRRFSLVVELTGHWADFDDSNVFIMANAGLAFHW